jgi:hypothetical protein
MGSPVLERLQQQRHEQIEFVDHLLSRVDAEGRDLVDAEKANLSAARQRIGELDDQITPLKEYEGLREASAAMPFTAPGAHTVRPAAAAAPDVPTYQSAGAYLVDYVASLHHRNGKLAELLGPYQAAAAARVERMREWDTRQKAANQITTDTPGILPTPVVGPVLNTIDANRPLITSLGARNMAGTPGTKFERPRITQHATSGKQAVQKTALASQPMTIQAIEFLKETHGGYVNISRQDIDWTSPTAWDILVQDLGDAYQVDTETSTSASFAGAPGMNAAVPVADNSLAAWGEALYQGAAAVYRGCGRLPDTIWCALDVWALMGPIVDTARLMFPPGASGDTAGRASLAEFAGVVFALPRVVVPTFPDGTCIIGASAMAEFYEERIGLLSAVEPSILGVEVAYGGYTAFGFLEPDGFTPITPPVAGP